MLALLLPLCALAQSSMTDDQVFRFIIKEHEAGTSQQQIVVQLMQRGVDITQIRRVRKKYERLAKEEGLGAVSNDTESGDDRTRNRKKQQQSQYQDSQYDSRLKDYIEDPTRYNQGMQIRPDQTTVTRTWDEDDEDFVEFQDELNEWLPGDTITMYENLVEQLKRQKKKIYGHDLFNNKKLTFEPNMNIATPDNYRLGPGDAVFIDIYGASQKTIEGTVSPDGTVVIEGFGPVAVGGMTVAQANSAIRSRLGSRYQSSKLRLTVGETRSIMVNVVGDVKVPGTYTLSAFATVFHALYMAGGVKDIGTLRNIKIYRNSQLISTVDIYDYLLNGRMTGNVRLQDNDMVMVGSYDCLVVIDGKVKRPMYYEMKRNESLAALIKYAGGFTGNAYKQSVRVIRKTGREYSIYNVDEFDMSSFKLADGDSISVDSILDRWSNMAEVKGAVFRPGMYQVGGQINSVKALIEAAGGLTEEAIGQHGVMHRTKADRSLVVMSIDINGILEGTVPDVPIKNEDVLYIASYEEQEQDKTITIHGEVAYPGTYKYAANQTVEDAILQAGGLTNAASLAKVDVARRIIAPEATEASDTLAFTYSFRIDKDYKIDEANDFRLQPYDEIYVRRSPKYNEQQNVIVEGEVQFKGSYTLTNSRQRLSEIIKQAGGLTQRAYPEGAKLMRQMTQEEREQMETMLRTAQRNSGNDSIDVRKLLTMTTFPMAIELDKAMANPGSDDDPFLREGDRIVVPRYTSTVTINGEVLYPNTVRYKAGEKADYYLDLAGGVSSTGKRSQTIIIYMNGMVAKADRKHRPAPGCQIVVPTKARKRGLGLTEWLSIGTSTASIATMIATIANLIK